MLRSHNLRVARYNYATMSGTPIFNWGDGVPFLKADNKLLTADSDASLNARIGSGYEVMWSQIEG